MKSDARPVGPEAPWVGGPTCLEIAGEALGLLGCVLKRLKILKSDSAGPVGPKFWSAPPNLKPLE